MDTEKDSDYSTTCLGEDEHSINENDGLLTIHSLKVLSRSYKGRLFHFLALYACNICSLVVIAVLWSTRSRGACDPTLGVYCKAAHTFDGGVRTKSKI